MNSLRNCMPVPLLAANLLASIIVGLGLLVQITMAYAETSSEKTIVVADSIAGQKKSSTCQGCHGADGNSYAGHWPNLAAQHATYIEKQIGDFQTGLRKDPTMTSMVSGLSKQDAADIAAYFSQQVIVPDTTVKQDSTLVALGKKIYKGGNVYSSVPACSSCHGPNGAGISPAKFPVLGGQKIEYLIKTLKDFRSATRRNDPRSIMQNIAASLSDNEIKSVANYIYTLPTAVKTASEK